MLDTIEVNVIYEMMKRYFKKGVYNVRLRRKPWVDEAIHDFDAFVLSKGQKLGEERQGTWRKWFGREGLLYVELGTGKGDFIRQMAERCPEINFIGIEAEQDVLYSAAKKVAEGELTNVRLLVFDINHISEIFAAGEVDRFYINFCDPWPKKRHAKRRLTHVNFLENYRKLLKPGGELHFKTDNRGLFDFSLEQFREAGLTVRDISFNLHGENREDNIMTEYERKFSGLGEKINRCEVVFP